MRLLSINFRNIHSLKGDHTISFESHPLDSAGIFAITGPTGSGKSTILDVIVLALFNNIPRFEKKKITANDIDQKGSVVTHFCDEAWAEVTYSCSQGMFRSRWEISKTRNGTWRDYAMSITDLSSNHTLPLKKSDIPNKNEELIGLNYEQFVKSILLSQGQFARFLKSKKNERYQLLEDITGATIYRAIGKQAYDSFQEKKKTIDREQSKIDTYEFLTSEQLSVLKIQIDELKKTGNEYVKEMNRLQGQKKLLEEWSAVLKESSTLESEDRELAQLQKSFIPNQSKLDSHRNVMPLAPEIILITNTEKALVQNRESKASHDELKISYQKSFDAAIEEMSKFIGKTVNSESFMDEMSRFEKRINELDNKVQRTKDDGERFRNDITIILSKLESEFANQLHERIQPKEALSLIKSRLSNLTYDKEASPGEIRDNIKRNQLRLSNFQKLLDLVNESEQLEAQAQKEDEVVKINNNLQIQKNTEEKNLQKKLRELDLSIQQLEKDQAEAIKVASLEELRSSLVEDEPCPLCGSTEHPYRLHQSYVTAGQLSVLLDKKKIEFKELSAELQQVKTALAIALENIKASKDRRKEQIKILRNLTEGKEKLEKEHEYLKISDSIEIEYSLNRLSKEIEQGEQKLNHYYEAELLTSVSELYDKLYVILGQYNDLIKERFNLYNGNDVNRDADLIQNRFIEARSKIEKEAALIEKLNIDIEKSEEFIHTKSKEISHKLEAIGLAGLAHAQSIMLSEEVANEFQRQEQEIQKRVTELETRKKENIRRRTELDKNKKPGTSIEEILSSIQSIQFKSEECNQKIGALEERIRKDKENREQHKSLSQSLDKLRKENQKFELLNSYIGDSTGNKFSNYAQSLTLGRLLALANIRLEGLSDRYLLDHSYEEDDLFVIDQYQGNSKRAINTLSGGETFIISLALALSLSDLASRNVKLECLFIDEGFGTLDPETLDMALSTLEKLQYESGKTIGIISHVASLKERIVTQIKVTKNPQGFSTLNVVH